jgi:hypothetical protein
VDLVARLPGHRSRSHHASPGVWSPVGDAVHLHRRPVRELPLAVPRNTVAPLAGRRSVLTGAADRPGPLVMPWGDEPGTLVERLLPPVPLRCAGLRCVRRRTHRAVCRSRAANATRLCTRARARASERCRLPVQASPSVITKP